MRIWRLAVAVAVALSLTSPVMGQGRAAVPASAAGVAGIDQFIDRLVADQIARQEVAGAVVTIVHRGRIVMSRGYGFADVRKRRRVDPKRTLFRPGSVSKLMTWVALLQQVEAGRVDLDADVNRYLDFRIPPFKGQPIRVRDLMAHALGMSDLGFANAAHMNEAQDFRRFVKANVPERVAPAGTTVAYSNYGAALAGYIVERVSGELYEDYVAGHVFKPLGMTSSDFHYPLPRQLARQMALGYRLAGGRFVAKPYENYGYILPAVGAASTADDMARFMLAILGDGALGKGRILSPASVALLESDSIRNAPDLPGVAHGFMVARERAPRILAHAGNTLDFHSYLAIVPDADLGFFVSYTGGRASYGARTELSEAIIGRLFPEAPAPRWTGKGPRVIDGRYRSNRRDYVQAVSTTGDVTVRTDGPRRVVTKQDGRELAWEQIGPRLYERATDVRDGGPYDRLEFYQAGNASRLSFASAPQELFERRGP